MYYNDDMRIPLPEGFHVMSDEERNAISKGQTLPAWAMADEEKHVMFTVSWKDIRFSEEEPQYDDITMVSFTYLGTETGDSKEERV